MLAKAKCPLAMLCPEACLIVPVFARSATGSNRRLGAVSEQGASMRFVGMADGRLFDLDVWDWSMMVGGSLLVGLVALLG